MGNKWVTGMSLCGELGEKLSSGVSLTSCCGLIAVAHLFVVSTDVPDFGMNLGERLRNTNSKFDVAHRGDRFSTATLRPNSSVIHPTLTGPSARRPAHNR